MDICINERCGEIINILFNSGDPLTIDELACRLNVSNRTIRNDLKKIKDFLDNNQLGRLVKKPRVGVWIDASENSEKLLKNIVNRSRVYVQPFSPEKRHLYIIKRLLQSRSSITMQLLADELYVSRVTVYKDLEEVEKWLSNYNLSLERKQNYGIEIVGDEKNWRKAAADLLVILKDDTELRNMLTTSDEIHPNSRLDFENYIQLKELFPDINVKEIEALLIEAEKSMEFMLADESFHGLLAHIAISIERLKQNKDIKMDCNQLNTLKKEKEYEIAQLIGKKVEERFNLKLPDNEVGYIALHILGSKIQQNIGLNTTEKILSNMDESIVNLAMEIISLIGNILSVDFSKDRKLLIGLVLHLRPAINRLKYGLGLRNPLLDDIKRNYPSVFGATWATSVLFEKYFGVKVNEEEIGYLAIHIGAALERQKGKTRGVMVCSSGIGTAQLAAVRLEKAVHDLQIVNIISAYEINTLKESDFDIIISTIPIKFDLKPTIQINPLVTDKDIERIKEYIKNIENTKKFNRGILESKSDSLFNRDLIFTNIKGNSREEIIRSLGNELVKRGFVEKRFIDTAIEREKITSTAVGKGIAIPHGTQEFVKQSSIAIATLQNPINWSGIKVDIVFLLALKFSSDDSTRTFFKRFYSILDSNLILENIRNSNTSKEIYGILVEGSIV